MEGQNNFQLVITDQLHTLEVYKVHRKLKLRFLFFGLLQLTTALVLIHSGISETSARLCRGHGLLHCAFIHDVGHGVFIHSYFQLENDQIYGIFYVCVLFHFCGHHTRI